MAVVIMWRSKFKTERDMVINITVVKGSNDFFTAIDSMNLNPDAIHFIITDTNVANIYLTEVLKQLKKKKLKIEYIVLNSGEQTKSFEVFENICKKLIQSKISTRSHVMILGGGVPSNVAGLAASTILRGVPLVLIPTTVLSQVDAAIDIKHAINTSYGKNIIGSFYPPSHVLINTNFIKTLSNREISSGLAEIIKHALIQSPKLFDKLQQVDPIFNSDIFLNKEIYEITIETINLKKTFIDADKNKISGDWKDMGPQYGHAFGHAIEHLSNYSYLHGEAIAIGMVLSAELSYLLGYCNFSTVENHQMIFSRFNLPVICPTNINGEVLIRQIFRDKYMTDSGVRMALLREVGKSVVKEGKTGIIIGKDVIKELLAFHFDRSLQHIGKIINE